MANEREGAVLRAYLPKIVFVFLTIGQSICVAFPLENMLG